MKKMRIQLACVGLFVLSGLNLYAEGLHKNSTYASIAVGNGQASEGGDMDHRAAEIRIGKAVSEHILINFVHNNEGHPVNNHRDGYAIQPTYEKSVGKNMVVQVGVGPYFSMNTTRKDDGIEYDDKHMGLLATAALLYYLNGDASGFHIRAEYNHVSIPGQHSSDAFLLGVGKNFDEMSDRDNGSDSDNISAAAFGIVSQTNHSYVGPVAGGALEIQIKESSHYGYTVTITNEGDDQYTNRQGVGVQAWYIAPINNKWVISAGAGPYVAVDKRGSGKIETMALFSLEAERTLGDSADGYSAVLRFSRVASSNNFDKDLLYLGVRKKIK